MLATALSVAALLVPFANAYFTGEVRGDADWMRCWQNGKRINQCPEGISVDWNLEEQTFVETFPTTVGINFQWDAATDAKLIPANSESLLIPHLNLHACRITKGLCIPHIKPDANSVTHAPAIKSSNRGGIFNSTIMLTEGMWTLIGHCRIYTVDSTEYDIVDDDSCTRLNMSDPSVYPWKLDLAIGAQIKVLPAPRELVEVDPGFQAGIFGFNMTLLVITLIACLYVTVMKKHIVIKASSPATILLSFSGIALALVTGLYVSTSYGEEMSRCIILPAGLSLSFWLTFGILGLKTWRTHVIFEKSVQLESWNLSNRMLGLFVFVACFLDAIILAVWFIVDTPQLKRLVDAVQTETDSMTCTDNYSEAWYVLLLAPKVIVVFESASMAYKVRDIPDNFNESRSLMIGFMCSMTLGSLCGVFALLLDSPVSQYALITCSCVPFSYFLAAIFLVVAKAWNIHISFDFMDAHRQQMTGVTQQKKVSVLPGQGAADDEYKKELQQEISTLKEQLGKAN